MTSPYKTLPPSDTRVYLTSPPPLPDRKRIHMRIRKPQVLREASQQPHHIIPHFLSIRHALHHPDSRRLRNMRHVHHICRTLAIAVAMTVTMILTRTMTMMHLVTMMPATMAARTIILVHAPAHAVPSRRMVRILVRSHAAWPPATTVAPFATHRHRIHATAQVF